MERREEPKEQDIRGSKVTMTIFVLADKSATTLLTLWESPEQILIGNTCSFQNLTVKFLTLRKLQQIVTQLSKGLII